MSAMTPQPPVDAVRPTLYLVDASLYVFRAWHSMPDEFRDADGWPTNAVHGFARFLLELLERERPRHIAIAFDEALDSCFRNALYPAYKANRAPAPEELRRQFAQCKALCAALVDHALWGIPEDRCHTVVDEVSPTTVGRTVRQAAASVGPDGLLLVYYAGHGLIDPADGSLILALPECEPEVPHEAGLPYEWIRRAAAGSGCAQPIDRCSSDSETETGAVD